MSKPITLLALIIFSITIIPLTSTKPSNINVTTAINKSTPKTSIRTTGPMNHITFSSHSYIKKQDNKNQNIGVNILTIIDIVFRICMDIFCLLVITLILWLFCVIFCKRIVRRFSNVFETDVERDIDEQDSTEEPKFDTAQFNVHFQ